MAEYELLFKVIIIGDEKTGKTSLLNRYADDKFYESYVSTVGVDFRVKNTDCDGKTLKAQIWDTAGNERFSTITQSYYRGCHGVIIVFDVTDRSSFKGIENWIADVERFGPDSVPKLLVGNKCDLATKRCVTEEDAKSMAVINNMYYVETSAKTNFNVDEAFNTIYADIHKNIAKGAV